MKQTIKIFFATAALILAMFSPLHAQNFAIRSVTGTPTAGSYTPGTRDSKTVYSTTTNKMYVWDGTGWNEISGSSQSGSYTPSISQITNCTFTSSFAMYTRTGNIVTLSASITVTVTSIGQFNFSFTIPYASNFTTNKDFIGGTCTSATLTSANVGANFIQDLGACTCVSTTAGQQTLTFTVQYIIK